MSIVKTLVTELWFPIFVTKAKLTKIKIQGWKLLYLSGNLALMRRSDGKLQKFVRYKEFGSLMLTRDQYQKWAEQQNFCVEDLGSELSLTPI